MYYDNTWMFTLSRYAADYAIQSDNGVLSASTMMLLTCTACVRQIYIILSEVALTLAAVSLQACSQCDARATRPSEAVANGAIKLWMPRLEAAIAQEIEAKRISFIQDRVAISPDSRKVAPLALFDRLRIRLWLDIIAQEIAPIISWLP